MNRSYTELREILRPNLKGLLSKNAIDQGIINDIAEVFEDIERLAPYLSAMVDQNATEDKVKEALGMLEAWSWHTAEHLAKIHSILEMEWDQP